MLARKRKSVLPAAVSSDDERMKLVKKKINMANSARAVGLWLVIVVMTIAWLKLRCLRAGGLIRSRHVDGVVGFICSFHLAWDSIRTASIESRRRGVTSIDYLSWKTPEPRTYIWNLQPRDLSCIQATLHLLIRLDRYAHQTQQCLPRTAVAPASGAPSSYTAATGLRCPSHTASDRYSELSHPASRPSYPLHTHASRGQHWPHPTRSTGSGRACGCISRRRAVAGCNSSGQLVFVAVAVDQLWTCLKEPNIHGSKSKRGW
ncbi:hypothetical protein BD289DRAFT_421896 [Coniella lustricola]|uniref:Uncharacterized protein n=1 Tax=Coniella lustricola TaxID=2025994 RepID=A0A2T3AL26_9PEZI|nr:hypothetical protein BD289DRAFT_421896 [Coniella lustricola]